ncbi:isoprenoid biosynthesis glyoxalase ElbB [Ferrimonas pelagia]|uniref:Glyoxalase n=1 Tax=Ferrimonas pelagia TaxID=1177826 RepID=A0ABP9EGM5_9GAMM
MKKIAVILSGSGVFDGSEIHEAVLTLLALARAGAQVQCFAPDRPQMHVVNHLTGEVEADDTRNILVEAARIARGEILPLSALDATEFDGLILPGGFGAAKNLCDFAVAGTECQVADDMMLAARQFIEAGKPSGYLCIAPIMLPKIAGKGVKGTIGTDGETAQAFNLMGGEHRSCPVDQIAVDEARKIVSSPAYMLAGNLLEAEASINALVTRVLEWID